MVKMARPHTLADIIEAAMLQEKNLKAIRKTQRVMTQKYPLNSNPVVTNRQNPATQMRYKWPNDILRALETIITKGIG